MARLIIGDFETTGLIKPEANDLRQQPHIIEAYLVKLDYLNGEFSFIDEISTFMRPPIPIDPLITKITGINDYHVRNAPIFAELYPRFCEFFLGETTFVAHNAGFDLSCLFVELARIEKQALFPWCSNVICTVEASMPIEHKRLKLKRLHEIATGHEHDDQHRARGDVEALTACLGYLIEKGYVTL